MTAIDIIRQIRELPDAEREKVNRFVRENLEPGHLSPEALGELTRQMVETKDPQEAARLREEIVRGFYGDSGPKS